MINNNIKPLDPFNVNFKESLWDLNNIFINNIKEINDYTHHFEIYCPISLGHTIGNALRRTLLEISTEVAPLAIKIYHHESFLSPITGVKESVLNIIKNIKQLILSTSEDRMQMISIQCNKPGKVTSKNIINFDQINILNKDLYICELDKGASLRIDILVGSVNHVFNTNYQKLLDLRKYQNEYDEYMDTLNSGTTLIIVGDGRNNYNDPRLDIFSRMSRRSTRTIWLNPEPEHLWHGDSDMAKYKPLCNEVLKVGNLRELANAVDDLMTS